MAVRTAEGHVEWETHTTWYRVVGELDPQAALAPVVIAHGGPGSTHDYVAPIAELLEPSGRACVLYDQIGSGRSQHLRHAPADFWTVDLFKRELSALLEELGIAGRYHFLGQSWGGMLAMEHALDHPPGLRSIVVADSPASIPLWIAEANRLRAQLPQDVQDTLARHEADGTTDDPAYEAATEVFYRRHLCRLAEWPEALTASFAQMAEDPTVYHTMNGPNEFHCIGTLKEWDITDRLPEIDVPALLISGRYDEATPHVVEQLDSRIPNSRWVLLEESSHTPHLEEPEAFREAVVSFLAEVDRA
jgi:L-proline amide hydrolase